MSDSTQDQPGVLHTEAIVNVTAGGALRQARQAAGLHIAALAVSLKVPVSRLEALESDNYVALPDMVFARALACSVCRALKLDQGPILALLPQSKSPRLVGDQVGLNAPIQSHKNKVSGHPVPSSSLSWPLLLAVAFLCGGALLLWMLPSDFDWRAYVPKPSTISADSTVAPTSASSGQVTQVPAESESPIEPILVPSTPVASEAGGDSPIAIASAPVVTEPATAEPALPQGILQFKARGESWVQVRDAKGVVVLQRNLQVGEVAAVSGALPLSVVVGRADVTDVVLRDKPFDLTPIAKDNVARFEVKP
jgi:cytoskeleton protein RodZ